MTFSLVDIHPQDRPTYSLHLSLDELCTTPSERTKRVCTHVGEKTMSGSTPVLFRRKLQLPDDDNESDNDTASISQSNRQIDGTSSLVALALEHHIPLLADGFTDKVSATTARAGSGSFATVDVTPRSGKLSGERYTWHGEEDLFFRAGQPAGRKLATKVSALHDRAEPTTPWASIAKEIRILAHELLRKHPNIVDIIALSWAGTIYDNPRTHYRWPMLLMEYADCGTLEDFFTLEGVELTWQLKIGISYDVVHGLEALDDSGVTHGDLKFSNVLVFRTGADSFTAKICDFGSAVVATDLPQDAFVQSMVFTPPWNAPESSRDIQEKDLHKIDIYGCGLLLCRIFLHGGDPFQMRYQSMPESSLKSIQTMIEQWKANDSVSSICKFAVRQFGPESYTSQQLITLDKVFDMTVRTDIDLRMEEYSQIKSILRPSQESEDLDSR